MKNSRLIIIFTALCLLLGFASAYAEMPGVSKHPVALTEKPTCTVCHTENRMEFNHTSDWVLRHKNFATGNWQVCNVCHEQSFCSDCHAANDELKPSDKYKQSPSRELPHRGDYINQHRIDGKINPAACYRCHARQNNERCKACHK